MAINWTNEEQETLISNIAEGINVSILSKLLLGRTEGAIIRRASDMNYGCKTTDGIKRFVLGKGTRISSKKTDLLKSVEAETIRIVGEPRIATTIQEPTISSESTNQNVPDESISNIYEASYKSGLQAYNEAVEMLESNNLPAEHDITCILSTYILQIRNGGKSI